MSEYTIDRIDDGWAALEDEKAKIFHVPAAWLPLECREGDVLQLITEDSEPATHLLRFTIDSVARQARQKAAGGDLRDQLPKGPEVYLALRQIFARSSCS